MKYELRKVLTNAYCVGLFLFLFLCNGYFFYQHLTQQIDVSYTYGQMKQMYARRDELDTLEADLEQRAEEAFVEWMQSDFAAEAQPNTADDTLLTGNIYRERSLLAAVRERISSAENYGSQLDQRIAEVRVQQQTGLFGSKAFPMKVLQQTQHQYEALQGWLTPKIDFFGGVERLTSFPLTDVLILFFGGAAALLLTTAERASGLSCLIRPTPKGHGNLYCRKFGAMLFLLLCGMVGLYGTNIGMTVHLLGLGDLTAPVQSVYGLEGCPIPLTVLGYLEAFFAIKVLWILAVCAVFFCLCCLTSRPAVALGLGIGLWAVTAFLGKTRNLWLRTLDLGQLLQTQTLFGGCFFLNWFGHPLDRLVWTYAELLLLLAAGFLGGLWCDSRLPAVTAAHHRTFDFAIGRHTNLRHHEGYKLFGMGGGAVVLALFLLVQLATYQKANTIPNRSERDYQHYSAILSGEPSEEKDAYLATEEARFAALQAQIDAYAQQCGANQELFQQLTQPLQEQLLSKTSFDEARQQYENLKPGQMYIEKTGYEKVFDIEGRQEKRGNTVKLILVCILGLSGVFAVEQETGMETLIRAYGGEKQVNRRKRQLMVFYLLVAMTIAYLPQYLVVSADSGLPHLAARANSLQLFAILPDVCPVWSVLAFTELLHLTFGLLVTWLISKISQKTGNTILTILISSALVLPAMLFV